MKRVQELVAYLHRLYPDQIRALEKDLDAAKSDAEKERIFYEFMMGEGAAGEGLNPRHMTLDLSNPLAKLLNKL